MPFYVILNLSNILKGCVCFQEVLRIIERTALKK